MELLVELGALELEGSDGACELVAAGVEQRGSADLDDGLDAGG